MVEEVGLRTTILRNLNGDRYIVPNGQIIGVRRMTRRYRTYSVDLLTRKPEDVAEALQELVAIAPVGAARFLRTPEVIEQRELHGVTLVRVRADVPPTMEWLVEQFLAKLLATRLQDSLVTEPLVCHAGRGRDPPIRADGGAVVSRQPDCDPNVRAFSVTQGTTMSDAAPVSHGLSRERLFRL